MDENGPVKAEKCLPLRGDLLALFAVFNNLK
jgi:hypothetical protein